jgi:DNA-binding MarR family transcriptional regulator
MRLPVNRGRTRPLNLASLMREVFVALNDLVLEHLAAHGHGAIRSSHSAVFQFLDDDGTTVSALAGRAGISKQAMAELVVYLEEHGYVTREPNPADRRAKLVLPTGRGREVIDLAQGFVPEGEARLAALIGADRIDLLRSDLDKILSGLRGSK